MALQADVSALFNLSRAFGPEGIRFALDSTEAAVRAGTEAAKETLQRCLKTKWPRSSISRKVSSRVTVSREAIFGIVRVVHDWVEVLVLGKPVPAHKFPARTGEQGPYVMTVGKKGKPKTYKKGPKAGQGPPVFISGALDHPGYKGADCATPTQKRGDDVFSKRIIRAVTRLAQLLARRRA